MTAVIAVAWYLGACGTLIGLCLAIAAGDTWLDLSRSRRRMWQQLAAIHHDTARHDTEETES